MQFINADQQDFEALVSLRIRAMQPSLEAVGRFDPQRARERFKSSFVASNTKKIIEDKQLIGFYVLIEKSDHLWLDHLYIDPDFQSGGRGGAIIQQIQQKARDAQLPVRLGALKQSSANAFYQKHGFSQIDTLEWDNIYQWQVC
jgi:N-acetylglutamate synthase-like GNAT family acetyltransferase